MKISIVLFILAACTLTSAQDNNNFRSKNADDAEKLTQEFAKLNANSPCKQGENACVDDKFAQCVGGKFVSNACAGNLKCVVLPLVNKPGTSITCSTEADRLARLADARGGGVGKASGGNNVNNPTKGGKGIGNNLENPDQGNGGNSKNIDGNGGNNNNNNKDGNGGNNNNNNKDGNGGNNNNNNKDGNGGNNNNNNKDGNGGNNNNNNKDGNGGNNNNNKNNGNGCMNGGNNNNSNENNGNGGDNNNNSNENNGNGGDNNSGNNDPSNTGHKVVQRAANDIAGIRKANAQKAEDEQKKFDSLTPDSSCTNNEVACVDDKLAQCSSGKFVLTSCGSGLKCASLPLVLKSGTSVTCTTEADRNARLDQARKNLK